MVLSLILLMTGTLSLNTELLAYPLQFGSHNDLVSVLEEIGYYCPYC
jgi:hypothetical protein